MSSTNELKNEIVVHGIDDWIDAAEVVSIIINMEGVTIKDEGIIKEKSIELIKKVLQENLMIIGNVDREGFKPWSLSIEESIQKVKTKWESLERLPGLGQVCWLKNTEKGMKLAEDLIATLPHK
jgi:hypothetical protein